MSDVIATNTGAPQGCVLSLLLFTLYTSDCSCASNSCQLMKYADNKALIGRCINDDNDYRNEVTRFSEWCSDNYLQLNVSKTKEMIIDFQRLNPSDPPLYINGEFVESVHE